MSGFETDVLIAASFSLPVLMTWVVQTIISEVLKLGQRALRQCLKQPDLGSSHRGK
jgi:hypothetical protein